MDFEEIPYPVKLYRDRYKAEHARHTEEAFRELPIEEHLERYLAEGLDRMEAMKRVAKDRGLSKREIYKSLNCHN